MDEIIISKITDVKYTGVSRPTDNPFWDTIRATSPLVIIPTPIFKESDILNLQILAINPHPITFAIRPTATNATEKIRMLAFKLSRLVFNPILAKNTGPNNI